MFFCYLTQQPPDVIRKSKKQMHLLTLAMKKEQAMRDPQFLEKNKLIFYELHLKAIAAIFFTREVVIPITHCNSHKTFYKYHCAVEVIVFLFKQILNVCCLLLLIIS